MAKVMQVPKFNPMKCTPLVILDTLLLIAAPFLWESEQ